MTYRIESRQQNVFGLGGHNYLALVDESGRVEDEIHGMAAENGKLVHTNVHRLPEVVGAAREVMSGSEADVRHIWKVMKGHANELGGVPKTGTRDDDAKAKYGALSPNSNSFRATVLNRSGFDATQFEPDASLWTPSTGIDLSDPKWWAPEHRWPGVPLPDPDATSRAQAPDPGREPLRGRQAPAAPMPQHAPAPLHAVSPLLTDTPFTDRQVAFARPYGVPPGSYASVFGPYALGLVPPAHPLPAMAPAAPAPEAWGDRQLSPLPAFMRAEADWLGSFGAFGWSPFGR